MHKRTFKRHVTELFNGYQMPMPKRLQRLNRDETIDVLDKALEDLRFEFEAQLNRKESHV